MDKAAEEREVQLVVFQLLDQTYGIDIAAVHEIIRMESITYVPRAPEFIEGIINLRGRIIPVIDLGKRFNLSTGERTKASRIIIVEVGGVTVGMIVDAVLEVLRVPATSIEPPPPIIHGIEAAYLRGIVLWNEKLIILLNLDRILFEHEQRALEEAQERLAAAIT